MNFFNKYIKDLTPYKLASHQIWEASNSKRKKILKLDWNEATIPPSPKVYDRIKAIIENQDIYRLYPKTNNLELLEKLSNYSFLPTQNIQYFSSSDSLHEYIVRAYLSVNDDVLIVGPTYDNFRLSCESQGAKVNFFNYEKDFSLNKFGLENEIKSLIPKMVYICSPNNPTGNLIDKDFLIKIINNFKDTIFLIDEAYFEFSNVTISDHVLKFENLLVSRTFSKAFALANFRIGYLLSSKFNIEQISKIRNAKNVPTITQEAAIAALSDLDYTKKFVLEVNEAKKWFINELNGFYFVEKVFESQANFVLIRFSSVDFKNKIFKLLSNNEIYVRNLTHNNLLQDTLRITIGTMQQMIQVNNVLKTVKF